MFSIMTTALSILPTDSRLGQGLWIVAMSVYFYYDSPSRLKKWKGIILVVLTPLLASRMGLPVWLSMPVATTLLFTLEQCCAFTYAAKTCALVSLLYELASSNLGYIHVGLSKASLALTRLPSMFGLPFFQLRQSINGLLVTLIAITCVAIWQLPTRVKRFYVLLLVGGQILFVFMLPVVFMQGQLGVMVVVSHCLYTIWCAALLARAALDVQLPAQTGLVRGLSMVCIALIFLMPLVALSMPKARIHRIIFLADDVATDFEQRPVHGVYGLGNVGMYGGLPDYWEARGVSASVIDREELKDDVLNDVSILTIIAPTRYFDKAEQAVLDRYMRAGGHVILFGDHTDVFGLQGPFNSLASQYGIRINYDSAVPVRSDWVGCFGRTAMVLSGFNHAIAEGVQIPYAIGASLDVPMNSQVLLSAKYAFEDAGDPLNDGSGAYLGNYVWECTSGEILGNVVLACRVKVGLGSIAAVGDTAFIQNVNSSTSDWVSYVANGAMNGNELVNLVFFTVILFVGTLPMANSTLYRRYLTVGSLMVALGTFCIAIARQDSFCISPENIAVIDMTMVRGPTVRAWEDSSLYGLAMMLRREGYWPKFAHSDLPRHLNDAELVVVVGDNGRPGSRRVKAIKRWVNGGGRLLVISGWNAETPIFREYGLMLDGVPLGPWPNGAADVQAQVSQPMFVEAWPILHNAQMQSAVPYYTVYGADSSYDLVVGLDMGAGKALFVGDERLFYDNNLEGEKAWNQQNIEFLLSLLEILTD